MEARVEPDVLDTPAAGALAIRGSVLRIAGYAAGSLLSVVSAALLTRHLGTSDFGRYAAIFSLITIVTGVVEAGTAMLGVREHSLRRGEEGRAFLATLLGLRLLLGAFGLAFALAFAVLAGYDSDMVLGAALAGAGMVLTIVAGSLAVPLQSTLRLGWVTALELLRQVATVVVLVALILAGAGIAPLLGAPIPVGLVVIAVTAVLVRESAGLRPGVSREEWARVLRMTLPYAAATAVGVLYAHVTVLALSVTTTDAETGIFSAAFRVYFVLAAIPGMLVASAFPILARAARDDRERLRYAVQRLLDACLVLGIGMALVTALGAPVAIEIIGGDDYADAVPVLRLLAPALLGTFLIAIGGFALLSLERYRALLIANALGFAISAGLTVGLAPSMGADAGAVGILCGDLTLGVMYFAALSRSGVRPSWGYALRAAPAAAVAGGFVLLLGLPALPATVVAAIVFAVLLIPLRAVPAEVLDALLPWRSPSH